VTITSLKGIAKRDRDYVANDSESREFHSNLRNMTERGL